MSATVKASWIVLLALLQSGQPVEWQGTWSAAAKGLAIAGQWTAKAHAEPNAGTGTWTLYERHGTVVASGSWSARKSEKAWEGAWSARLPDGKVLSGKWATDAKLDPAARFVDLFESALRDVVSGTWRHGGDSGTWSIRAARKR